MKYLIALLLFSCSTPAPTQKERIYDIYPEADTECPHEGIYEMCVDNSRVFYKLCDGSTLLGYGSLTFPVCQNQAGVLDWSLTNRIPDESYCDEGTLYPGDDEDFACTRYDYRAAGDETPCGSTDECGFALGIHNSPYTDLFEEMPEIGPLRSENQTLP